MDPELRRFVIVGAGFAGAATAWHLRRAGVRGVLVLEREALPDVHASGRNAAMLRETMEEPELQDLAHESARALRTGGLAAVRPTGGLVIGWGQEDVAEHVPPAHGKALFAPGDGIVDVAALQQGYLRGTEVRYGCEVLSFHAREDGVCIETSDGVIEAEVLVNATGAWAGTFADLPLTPRNRTLYVSAPDPAIDPDWPFVWDVENGYYLRPESGGWLLCGCDEVDAEPGDYTEDGAVLPDLAAKLRAHQPGIGDVRVVRGWVGQRTFAPDRLPVIGFDARSPRLFHVAALGGHGVTLSWAVGRLAADLLLGTGPALPCVAPARLAQTPVGESGRAP